MRYRVDDALTIVRKYADAWAAGDAATLIALYADDVVLHYFGDNPLGGDHAGKAAALAVLGRLSNAVKRGAPEIHDVLGGEHHAAILAKERWGDGPDAIELNRVLLYHVRGGKISECWIYDENQRGVDRILRERLTT